MKRVWLEPYNGDFIPAIVDRELDGLCRVTYLVKSGELRPHPYRGWKPKILRGWYPDECIHTVT